ncbi:hypothetical protein B0H17DRAFT_1175799 [Mycena rosella]|uniref:Uncharacterized protein n=1 Tax=Mycena rosella TaxID=1033263 RepID=A0AAD7DZZ1_MYCRO|nr:hypothetical protein B0H17DRAFT_1175799 [Mycena rosella]
MMYKASVSKFDYYSICFMSLLASTMYQISRFSLVPMSKCRVLDSSTQEWIPGPTYFGGLCPLTVARQSFDQRYGSRRTRLAFPTREPSETGSSDDTERRPNGSKEHPPAWCRQLLFFFVAAGINLGRCEGVVGLRSDMEERETLAGVRGILDGKSVGGVPCILEVTAVQPNVYQCVELQRSGKMDIGKVLDWTGSCGLKDPPVCIVPIHGKFNSKLRSGLRQIKLPFKLSIRHSKTNHGPTSMNNVVISRSHPAAVHSKATSLRGSESSELSTTTDRTVVWLSHAPLFSIESQPEGKYMHQKMSKANASSMKAYSHGSTLEPVNQFSSLKLMQAIKLSCANACGSIDFFKSTPKQHHRPNGKGFRKVEDIYDFMAEVSCEYNATCKTFIDERRAAVHLAWNERVKTCGQQDLQTIPKFHLSLDKHCGRRWRLRVNAASKHSHRRVNARHTRQSLYCTRDSSEAELRGIEVHAIFSHRENMIETGSSTTEGPIVRTLQVDPIDLLEMITMKFKPDNSNWGLEAVAPAPGDAIQDLVFNSNEPPLGFRTGPPAGTKRQPGPGPVNTVPDQPAGLKPVRVTRGTSNPSGQPAVSNRKTKREV